MTRQRIIQTVTILVILLCFANLAGMVSGIRFDFVLTDGDSVLIEGNYRVKLSTYLNVKYKYKGSYSEYFEDAEDRLSVLKNINEELYEKVNSEVAKLEKRPVANSLLWTKDGYKIVEGENGFVVDRYAVYKNIFYGFSRKVRVDVNKFTINPRPTKEELLLATKKLSTFKTNYSSSTPERKHNIALACAMIDGYILKSGQSFSFNQAVGERTKERGFKEAKVIERGQFVLGIGGGVCQVSTTLYNAALLAGMQIDSVRHHSLPVSYVNLSFDAMVSSQTDLVFTNPTPYDIFIRAKAEEDNLSFTFFGRDIYEGGNLKLRSVTIKQLVDNDYITMPDNENILEVGENERIITQAKIGYVSEGYLEYYEENKLVWSKKIRSDTYQPQKGVKIVRNTLIDSFDDSRGSISA